MKRIQSVERAFALLEILDCNSDAESVGVLELAKLAGLKGPTTHNFLQTLTSLGYVEQDAKGKYRLAERSRWLGWGWNRKYQLVTATHGMISALALELDETVILTAKVGCYWQTLFSVESSRDLTTRAGRTMTRNFYISATGRCILATLTEQELLRYVENFRMPTREEWPEVTDIECLRARLEKIRYDGYELYEKGTGISGVGAVLPPSELAGNASIGIIVPSFRFKDEHRLAILNGVRATAAAIANIDK